MDHSLKPLLTELERLFEHYNHFLFSDTLPTPIITIQKGKKSLGWFIHDNWKIKDESEHVHEINLTFDTLALKTPSGIPEIAVTLLHEMVHLYNFTKKRKDISENGYHKVKLFGHCAESFGLIVEYSKKYPGCLTPDLNKLGKEILIKFRYNNKGRKVLRPLQCPICHFKVQVWVGFIGKLQCCTCNSILIEIAQRIIV